MKTPLFLALTLTACSALDPSVGPWRIEQPVIDGGAPDAGAEPCSEVGPDEICFARDIRPLILRTRDEAVAAKKGRGCFPCHDGNAAVHNGTSLSGFDMSTLGELRKGGGSSSARIIVRGKPDESVLVQVLRGTYPYANRMPKSGPWHEEGSDEMQLIIKWIEQGARGARDE